jgi:SHO1 osmosensor
MHLSWISKVADQVLSDIADPEDPFELSFNKGDILDIIDPQYKWWWVMKEDGSVGSMSFQPLLTEDH